MSAESVDPGTEVALAFAEVAAASERAAQAMQESQAGTDLQVRGSDASTVKAQAAATYARALSARADLAAAQKRAKDAVEAQKSQLEEMLRQQMLLLAPLKEQIEQAQEVIHTVNLYLGRDEQIVTLTSGTPASADTPLMMRQAVLAMDEETGAKAATGGIDVRDIGEFDAWITSDPAHLQQVFPEPRGVVAIMPRRTSVDYGDPWTNQNMNKRNHETWWLIRNGENLYRMLTDFNVGRRLVPRRDEFTAMFVDRFTHEPLQPGSRAWMEAEKAAGARERHFMKIALILQGLVDRTGVFAPLPPEGLNLLAPADYDSGKVVLLADDEMALTSGRTPFDEWLKAKNSLLSPGHRILVQTHHNSFPDFEGSRWSGRHPRVTPATAELPSSKVVHTISRRSRGSLVFSYERTDQVWDPYEGYRAPKQKASFRIQTDDAFVLPIDLVTITEMRDYLDARTERHAYEQMFPTLRAAIAFKEAEAEQEAPFRALLASQIAQAEDIDLPQAEAAVEEEVMRWKVGNRWHRALTGEPQAEAKAAREILAERARRASADQRVRRGTLTDEQAVQRLRERHHDALLIARRKSGGYRVLTPQPRRWAQPIPEKSISAPRQVGPLNVFTTLYEYTITAVKNGAEGSVREWFVPAPAQVSKWVSLFESERWATWNKRAEIADHLTDPEIEHVLDSMPDHFEAKAYELLAVDYQDAVKSSYGRRPYFTLYLHPRAAFTHPERLLTENTKHPWVATLRVWWRRDSDGRPSLSAEYIDENGGRWNLNHRSGDERVSPPWSSYWSADESRPSTLVHVEEATLARVRKEVQEWAVADRRREKMIQEAARLISHIEKAWSERALAAAKERFLEDYRDESLWADHSKSMDFTAPFSRRSHVSSSETRAALDRLVERLIEEGRPPYGLTVAEAQASLGEDLVETTRGYTFQGRRVAISEDVLTLRFPD